VLCPRAILTFVACEIRIGTSGWHYRHWLGRFYPKELPAREMFAFYQQHFDTVELNNSFYRLPTPEAFDCWRESSPAGFIFAVKGSRFVTHNKKLKEPEQPLKNLLPRAERLREKLGPILWQLPPRWRRNVDRLEEFLQALPKRHRYAFEFREPSWHHESVYEVLRRHNAAYCVYELAGFSTDPHVTADFAYVRLHGPGGKYQGSYSKQILQEWAARMAEWRLKLSAIYLYFDNDQAGYAAQNALELKRLVSIACPREEGADKAA
jgi:uncharacterized protein YecE (DUF72 family)